MDRKERRLGTLLKVIAYIGSYYLWEFLWGIAFVVILILQYRSNFGDEWGAFIQDEGRRTKLINTIVSRIEVLEWHDLAAAVTWLLLLFLFFRVRRQPVPERMGLKKCAPMFLLAGALVGIGGKMLNDGIYVLFPQLIGEKAAGSAAAGSFMDLYLADPGTGLNAVLRILAIGIMVPIVEEILFRGICFTHLKRIWPVPASVAVISAMFGLVHIRYPMNYMLLMAFWSIFLCLLAHRAGSVLPSIFAHMLYNLISVIRSIRDISFQRGTGIVILICGVLFLIGGGLLLMRLRPSVQTKKSKRAYLLLLIPIVLIAVILLPVIRAYREKPEALLQFGQDKDKSTVVYSKEDLDRIVGVELREREWEVAGIACTRYWNNRNTPTIYDDLRFHIFDKEKDAKKALKNLKEHAFYEITDEGDNYVRGWLDGVMDADVEEYYYLHGNLLVETTVTCVDESAREIDDPSPTVFGGGEEASQLIRLITYSF